MDLKRKISTRQKNLKIAMSIPGIEFTSAATILAEIGNYRNFSSPEHLASYFGLVPFVNQSANKLHNGCKLIIYPPIEQDARGPQDLIIRP